MMLLRDNLKTLEIPEYIQSRQTEGKLARLGRNLGKQ